MSITKEEKAIQKAQLESEKEQAKEEKVIQKAKRQSQKNRAKEEKKSAKRASTMVNKQRNPQAAFKQIRKVQVHFLGLPPVLWPLVALVAYLWARNTWEKERQVRDLQEARLFLKEPRGYRV